MLVCAQCWHDAEFKNAYGVFEFCGTAEQLVSDDDVDP